MTQDDRARRAAHRHGHGGSRLCPFSRCRAPLPAPAGPGAPFTYCPDRTWPLRKGGTATCAELSKAEQIVFEATGAPAITQITLNELVGQVETVVTPVTELATLLNTVREELQGNVTRALTDQDEANKQAADERGRRLQAERDAEEARTQAAAARTETADARAETEAHKEAADRAATMQRRAEDAATAARARFEAANQQVADLTLRVNGTMSALSDLGAELATVSAKRDSTAEALEAALAREKTARQTTETVRQEAESRLETLRGEHAAELETLRAAHADSAERTRQAHSTQTDALRAEHRDELDAIRGRHAQEVAQLHARIGALEALAGNDE